MVSKSGCLGWIKKRSNLEKVLLASSSILLLVLLLVILIGATYHGKNTNPLNDETSCWSKECIQTAGEVLKSLNPEADPCRNFYDYACGKYGQEQTVPVERQSTDSVYFSLKRLMESRQMFDIQGLDDVRGFYNTCVTFGSHQQNAKDTGEGLFNLMKSLGMDTWPVLDTMYSFSDFSLERYLTNLILLGVPVAFNLEVVPDQQIAGSYIVKISPGRPMETGRTRHQIRNDSHLRSSVLTSFVLLGSTSGHSDVADILDVDGGLADITEKDENTTCDVDTLAPREVRSELEKLIPEIEWDVILSEIRNKTGLARPFAVELHCKQKIKAAFVYLNDVLPRILTNYLGWRFFSEFAEHVIPTFEKSQFGRGERVDRWRLCLQLLEKFSSPILADLLSREIVPKEVQDEVERISNASLIATELLVSRASWLSEVQRSRISDKISRIKIRYPYKRISYSGNTAQVIVPKADVTNFTQVVIHRQREEVIQRFRRLNRGNEYSGQSGSWKPMLTEIDSFTSPDLTAYVYFDKIRTPYLRLQGSRWMNYGGFGMFIAREISKVLISLNAGVGYEEKDLLWNVWSQNMTTTTCLTKQMGNTFIGRVKMFSSRAEDKLLKSTFLDHSALEIAYEAAKSTAVSSKSLPGVDFSDEQFFFVSYAQTTCEADLQPQKTRERLISVRTFKSFGKVFSCAALPTCQIWA